LKKEDFMKVLTVTIAALSILMASYSVYAQDAQKESYFGDCVDRFIASCEHKASMMDSDSTNIQRDAAIASMKAAFYKSHKEELINQMLAQDLDTSRGDADYFLVRSFYSFCEADLARSLANKFETMTSEGERQAAPRVGMRGSEP
jgi:hypothetical protein